MDQQQLQSIIQVAKGEKPADVVLKHGKIVNVFSGCIEEGDVAVFGDRIVGIGKYVGRQEIDCRGKYVTPGFIDAHVHIESSMMDPVRYVQTVLPHGTTGLIVDPHEIANVRGAEGVSQMAQSLATLPINAKIMYPSCVPATDFATPGAILGAKEVAQGLREDAVFGLGEMMNYVGVLSCDPQVLNKIAAAHACDKPIDGHFISDRAEDLNAYRAAGIATNHECTSVEQMRSQLARGLYVQMREGSAARNVTELVKGVTPSALRRCVFCSDDKHIDLLIKKGHIDHNLKIAVAEGLDPVSAVTIATLNAAECYGLKDRGAIAPGYFADLVIVEDLKDFKADSVFYQGKLCAQNGQALFTGETKGTLSKGNSVLCRKLTAADFILKSDSDRVKTIRPTPRNITTQQGVATVAREANGTVRLSKGLLKIAEIERHHATGNIGLGLVEGVCLRDGAIAQTVAHDTHNLVVLGDNDGDMALAANVLREIGGGMTVVYRGKVLAVLPLPIAGLMSDVSGQDLYKDFEAVNQAVKQLGVDADWDLFMTLSFLCLPVIPALRLTDCGLFDTQRFGFTAIEAD